MRRGGTPFQPQFAFLGLARRAVVTCQSSSGTMRRRGALIRLVGGAVRRLWLDVRKKKQGAAGITTPAPYVAGRWGRGIDRLP
jgi:hypothetical protein